MNEIAASWSRDAVIESPNSAPFSVDYRNVDTMKSAEMNEAKWHSAKSMHFIPAEKSQID